MDVDTLSDEDLYSQLRVFRPELGPVVDTTRILYRNMLKKALDGKLSPVVSPFSSIPSSQDGDVFSLPNKSPRRRKAHQEDDTFEVLGDDATSAEKAEEALEGMNLSNKYVDSDYRDEWVQNDAVEVSPARFSFFLKAVFFGIVACFVAIAFIQYWVEQHNRK